MTLEQTIADENEAQLQQRASLEEQLFVVRAMRDSINDSSKELKKIEEPLRFWLTLNDGEHLIDGEHGLEAWLTTSQGAQTYDVSAMPDELILRLAKAHCLEVNGKQLKGLEGKDKLPEDAKKYPGPYKGGAVTLHVEQRK